MCIRDRCSDGSCEAAEDLISGFSAIEAEAELVQIGLQLCAAAVIRDVYKRQVQCSLMVAAICVAFGILHI